MIALFVALGIAVITLLALLLWFVPHLMQKQALRAASDSAQLREMILDMLNEQEAVMLRQSQLSTSIAYLQDQLEQMIPGGSHGELPRLTDGQPQVDAAVMRQLEERISAVQAQIQIWMDGRAGVGRERSEQDNEAWAYLLSLLSAIQQRVGELSVAHSDATVQVHAAALLDELEQEMQHLRSISEDIETLQWRLRRSLHERETNMSALRARPSTGAR